jgi:hypothetical protein
VGEDVRGREQYSWRVWWDRPSRWRDEIRWRSDLTDVAVVRGNSSLIYVAGQRTMYTSERPEPDAGSQVIDAPRGIVELPTVESRLAIFPLFRPPLPQSQWAFAIVGDEEMYLRRRVRRVRAKRRSDASPSEVLSGYWQGIDEYECVVDDELRILLSLAGIAQGRPVATIASDAVRVNVDLADDIFSFVPPRGARIAPISLSN